jgi:uncharacterized membrane protein YphA (DoxX/SURF4 family)
VYQNATGRELAYLLLRVTLGVNILMHGLAHILSGLSPFAAGMVKQFVSTPMPPPLVHAFAMALPWSELFLGIAILLRPPTSSRFGFLSSRENCEAVVHSAGAPLTTM